MTGWTFFMATLVVALSPADRPGRHAWAQSPRWALDPHRVPTCDGGWSPPRLVPLRRAKCADPTTGPREADGVPPPSSPPSTSTHPRPPPHDASEIMALSRAACHRELHARGIPFTPLKQADIPVVAQPVRLAGPVHGVRFHIPWSRNPTQDHHTIWDCRLVVAVGHMAEWLHARGITEVQYFSALRRGAMAKSRPRSMHNRGLAIDILGVAKTSDTLAKVETNFPAGRLRACPPTATGLSPRKNSPKRLYAELICHLWQQRLFHTVLTPDYDQAHHNHLHLDLKPDQPAPANPFVSLASGSAPPPP